MLKRYGLYFAGWVLAINMLTAILMIYSVEGNRHPNLNSENIGWHDNIKPNTRWIAGSTVCNPRIVLCH